MIKAKVVERARTNADKTATRTLDIREVGRREMMIRSGRREMIGIDSEDDDCRRKFIVPPHEPALLSAVQFMLPNDRAILWSISGLDAGCAFLPNCVRDTKLSHHEGGVDMLRALLVF